MTNTDILSVAIDAVKGKYGNYSAAQTSDEIVRAFVEMNGGSTVISPKTFYRGTPLYELVQELIPVVVDEGLKTDDNPLFDLVEYRNIKDGDSQEFVVNGDANIVVATSAKGIRDVRRQRITGGDTIPVPTEMKIVRVYENLGRLLAGRIDFSQFVDAVAGAFKKAIAEAAYDAIAGMTKETAGLEETYVYTGNYSEDALVALIDHVEAANGGADAKVVGTRSGIRKLTTGVVAESAKADLYEIGYYGKFNGTDVVRVKQAHKSGTTTFALNDNKILVVAGDDRPIKVVNSGDGLLMEGNPADNADLTQEYVYGQEFGVAAICATKIGLYNING